jgi:hypothetical protein
MHLKEPDPGPKFPEPDPDPAEGEPRPDVVGPPDPLSPVPAQM